MNFSRCCPQLNNSKEIFASSNRVRILQFEIGTPNAQDAKLLVAWYYGGKFITFINSFTLLSNGNYFFNRINLNNKSYLNFQINGNNKVGLFNRQATISMQQFQKSSTDKQADPTCMQKTNNWNDCMSCAYNECTSDWACGLACGFVLNSLGCATVWGIGCAIN